MPAQRIHVVAGIFCFYAAELGLGVPGLFTTIDVSASYFVKKLYISGCSKKSVELH